MTLKINYESQESTTPTITITNDLDQDQDQNDLDHDKKYLGRKLPLISNIKEQRRTILRNIKGGKFLLEMKKIKKTQNLSDFRTSCGEDM